MAIAAPATIPPEATTIDMTAVDDLTAEYAAAVEEMEVGAERAERIRNRIVGALIGLGISAAAAWAYVEVIVSQHS